MPGARLLQLPRRHDHKEVTAIRRHPQISSRRTRRRRPDHKEGTMRTSMRSTMLAAAAALAATLVAGAVTAGADAGPPWGPEAPNFNLEVILRPPSEGGNGFGHVKFRQPNDGDKIVYLDTWVRDLAPQHSYVLQRAVDAPN